KGFVGSRTQPGWAAMGSWAFPDPGETDPALPLEARRALLREEGRRLAPGSGDPAMGRYADLVIGADVALRPPVIPVSGASAAVAPATGGEQIAPGVAYDAGGRLYAVWSDTRDGAPGIRLATSDDGGASWSAST